VFHVHTVDERGRVVLCKQLRRDQVTAFFANLRPWVIGMEACGSAHHWARTLKSLSHDARLMSPQFVKPYVESCAAASANIGGSRCVLLPPAASPAA